MLGAALLLGALAVPAGEASASRIKDITSVEGIRDNLLVGYGLVVGLPGTGDSLSNSPFTQQSLIGMLERLGVNIRDSALKTQNVAAVMVTATFPPFARQGTRIDSTVSALGDAKSLRGGTLLVTPMLGADGEVYAVSQGTVAVAGFSATGNASSVTKGVPTTGRIANGAIIEREIAYDMSERDSIKLALRNPDFTTARRIATAVNGFLGTSAAEVMDPTTVTLSMPASYNRPMVDLLTDIEQLEVAPDQIARVVIDEQSGVIVMGEKVMISTVAIAQGNLTIRITETPQVSQPNPFSSTGTTATVDRTQIQVDESAERKVAVLNTGVSLQQLVNGLNLLGVGPRDLIAILQAIKAAGALDAEIELM
ncbi:MAG: flagellar basal body P-ring protein FlgI [Alphaproteobacteria bacterium]